MTRGNERRMRSRKPKWTDGAKDRERLVSVGGDFIRHSRPWKIWATLTFGSDTTTERWALKTTRRLVRKLARRVREHLWFTMAVEPQERGAAHVHLLIDSSSLAKTIMLAEFQSFCRKLSSNVGKCEAVPYDPELDAAHYMLRHDDWTPPEVACPRFRDCKKPGQPYCCKEAKRPCLT